MSRHYGRTTLLQLYGGLFLLLALLMLCTSGAEADDTRPYMNCHGHWIPVEECDDTDTKAIYPIQTVPGPGYEAGELTLSEGPPTEYVTGDEVAALLERCLEYVRDGDANYLEHEVYDTTLMYVKPHRTLKDDAQSKVNEAKAEKDRIDRETKLRRDIEALLGKLRKGE